MTDQAPEAVAIIGAGCRFPGGVADLAGFWRVLRDGTDVITEIPPSRSDLARHYDPDPDAPGRTYTRWGGFIEDETRFDAEFFGIAPREARQIDPQQRMLIEVAWDALEHAGIVPGSLAGTRTSVFSGGLSVDYFLRHSREAGVRGIDPWYASGKEASFGPGRLSYLLGLNGPSVALSTACSSSLVAVHLARQSLLTGESDTALVGGVNLLLSAELTVFMSKVGAMAKDGHCKVFDAAADGIVRGDGCVVLVLKRLTDALADGDRVLSVIRGSAVNHDGHSAGLTVPSAAAQQSLLRDALAAADVRPDEIGYVEAHGTGTPLGDPIEMSALARILGEGRDAEHPLLVGSLKTNFGHTDGAAGAAGLLKAALAAQHGEIPPHLHLDRLNPGIRWDRWPVRVPTDLTAWPDGGGRRLAGVSAFGLSGTNAHVIVEAPPAVAPPAEAAQDRPSRLLLPVSARSGAALRELARAHRDRLLDQPEAELAAYVTAAGTRRTQHREHRIAVTGRTATELAQELGALLETSLDTAVPDLAAEERGGTQWGGTDAGDFGDPGDSGDDLPQVCFVFSGQGGQWTGMGRELLAHEDAFRTELTRVDELIAAEAGWSVIGELTADAEHSRLTRTEFAQPVVFAVQVAAAALWRSWGVEPAAVIGHSMGEIAAAHVAGALTLTDAVRVIVHRGHLLQRAEGGGRMASVALPEADLLPLLAAYGDDVTVAAVNGPASTVVSGRTEAVEALGAELAELGHGYRAMPGEYAFHSAQMAPYQDELVALLGEITPAKPRVPVHLTCEPGADGPFGADYWGRNLRQPVRFSAALGRALDAGHRLFVELGPHPVLAQPVVQSLEDRGVDGLVVPTLRRDTDDVATARTSLARLYAAGVDIRWPEVNPGPTSVTDLPGYPWQGDKLWFDIPAPDANANADTLPQLNALHGELKLYDEAGRLVAETVGLRLSTPGAPLSETAPPALPAPVDAAPATAPATPARPSRDQLADLVADAAAEVLGLASGTTVARGRGFTDLGMDSLGAVELCKVLERSVPLRLPKTAAFDHPTVRRFAAYLDGLLGDAPAPAPAVARTTDAAAVSRTTDTPAAPAAPTGTPGAPEPIAVIGVGCRFPGGAEGPDAYWRLLTAGRDAVRRAPDGRFDDPRVWWGGFLDDDPAGFDAPFFRIPPREAKVMDPQQRMFLEVAWEALEHAGVPPTSLAESRTGVFLGMNSTDYAQIVGSHPDNVDAFYGTGTSFSAAAGRLSYLLGMRGPSLAVDTACSSSLVAVHLAVASLRSGESDLAVAAGVNLILGPTIHRASDAAGALAADGRCKTFDATADGYTRGEGCGAVILKPLSAARRDGDRVLALILGSAVNQDGASSGFTAPNGPAQETLLRAALADARVGADDMDYVEAHGTGTPLGDPIELRALGAALAGRTTQQPCLVGSVKTNIGHLEAASGIAGLIKTVLALRHETVPAHLHFTRPSPDIPWDELPLDVPTEARPWARGERRRVAGVSAFGFSGTNAHIVLAEAPATDASDASDVPDASGTSDADDGAALTARLHVLPLSAASPAALRGRAAALRSLLSAEPDGDAIRDAHGAEPAAVARTLAVHRSHLDHRLVVVGRDRAALAERLTAVADGDSVPGTVLGKAAARARGPVFVFSGHGSYWPAMGRSLLAADPVFRDAIADCDAALARHLDWSVREALESAREPSNELDQQIMLFATQYGLTASWRALGVEPAAVLGHSMGEVSAALCAGALDLTQAAEIMVRRTHLLRALVGQGGMAVVGLDADRIEDELAPYGDRLCVAVVNSRQSTVVSGETTALEELGARMRARNVFFRAVNAGGPAHSPWAEPLREQLVHALTGLAPAAPRLPMYSSVDGAPLAADTPLDAAYWGRNLRQTVRFADAVRAAAADGHDTFVELSAHPIQLVPIEQELRAAGTDGLFVPSLLRDQDGPESLLTGLGALHVGGQAVDWPRLHPGNGPLAELPTYPWEHKRYWVDQRDAAPANKGAHPLLTRDVRTPSGRVVETDLDARTATRLGAEPVGAALRVPGATWLELAVAAAGTAFGPGRPVRLEDITLDRPLLVPADGSVTTQLTLERAASGDRPGLALTLWEPASDTAPRPRRLVSGRALPGRAPSDTAADAPPHPRGPVDEALRAWVARHATGDCAPTPESARTADGRIELELRLRPATMRWHLAPDLLELALRLPAFLLSADPADPAPLPASLDSLTLYAAPDDRVLVTAALRPDTAGDPTADIRLTTPEGRPLAEITGLRLAPPRGRVLNQEETARLTTSLYVLGWQERPLTVRQPEQRPAETPARLEAGPPQRGLTAHVPAQRDGLGASRTDDDPSTAAGGAGALLTGPVTVVLADRGGVAEELARALAAQGRPTTLLAADGEPDAVRQRLADALRELRTGPGCRDVVHLGALDLPERDEPDPLAVADVCAGVTAVASVTAAVGSGARVLYVTRGAVAVDELELPAAAQAPLRQSAIVSGVERPTAWGAALDLDPLTSGVEEDAAAVAAELLAHGADRAGGEDVEDQIALRAGRRLTARVLRAPAPPPLFEPVELAADRSYLVAGAEGPLPDRVAAWLTARGAGRTLVVPRVEDAKQATRLIEDEAAAGHPVAGVIWLGVGWNLPIDQEPTAAAIAEAVEDRARGAWLLHQAALDTRTDLDLFQVWGTVASAWAAIGAGVQAPVDALLTALAGHRRALGLPVCAIAWAPWLDVDLLDRDSANRLTRSGMRPLPPGIAVELLDRITAAGLTGAAAADADWGLLLPLYQQARPWPLFDALAAEAAAAPGDSGALLDKLRSLPDAARGDLLLECVLEEVAVVLGLDGPGELEPRQGFFELGLNSITALEMKVRLERRFGSALPATLAFEYPTGDAVAGFLAAEVVGGSGDEWSHSPQPAADSATRTQDTGRAENAATTGRAESAEGTADNATVTGDLTDEDDYDDPDDADLFARLDAEVAAVNALIEGDKR
ncbi:beta-ketoacyl synthase N-terminal-like domain-containing protein [Streptomyces sp. NPDC003300]|uniref:type I polyketide synthase n=1 Tax=unclassified Streptomyces TaxID=2593676 RepID=UPI0033A5AE19